MRARVIVLVLGLAACDPQPVPTDAPTDVPGDAGPPHEVRPFEPTPETIAYCAGRDDASIELRITEMLGMLSLEEKVEMMHGSTGPAVDGRKANAVSAVSVVRSNLGPGTITKAGGTGQVSQASRQARVSAVCAAGCDSRLRDKRY